MKHNFRNIFIFYTIAVIIFIIVGGLLSVYSLGYRINWQNNKIYKTGLLRLEPTTKKYSVYLDNQPVDPSLIGKKTEIANLLPGKHEIKIQLENFQTWQKQIVIEPGLIKNNNNIILIPKKPTTQIITTAEQIYPSPDKLYFAEKNNNSINLYYTPTGLKQNNYDNLLDLPDNTTIFWTNNHLLMIIIKNPLTTSLTVINPDNHNTSSYLLNDNYEPQEILGFSPYSDNNLLIYKNQSVYSLNPSSSKEQIKLLYENIQNPYLINNNLIYQTISPDNQNTITNHFLTLSTSSKYLIPNETTYQPIPNQSVGILNKSNKQYLINIQEQDNTIPLSATVKSITNSPDKNIVAFLSDNEISIYNTQTKNFNTIVRLTETITSFGWLNNFNLVYTSANTIYRIDLDRENLNTIFTDNNNCLISIINSDSEKISANKYCSETKENTVFDLSLNPITN